MQVKALSILLLATSALAAPRGGHGFGGNHGGQDNNAVQAGGNQGGNAGGNAGDAANAGGAGNAGNAGGNAGNAGGNAGGDAGNAGGNAGNAGGNNGGNAGGNGGGIANNNGGSGGATADDSGPDTPPDATGEDVATAAKNWQVDTNTVSNFLSTGGNLSGKELQAAALKAFNAEVNELTHKAVLDKAFGRTDPEIVKADATLVAAGTFQFVVDKLNNLAQNGSNLTPEQVTQAILAINNDRCPLVLPSIDAYTSKGSNGQIKAVRPNNCPFDTKTVNDGNKEGAPLDSVQTGGNQGGNAGGNQGGDNANQGGNGNGQQGGNAGNGNGNQGGN